MVILCHAQRVLLAPFHRHHGRSWWGVTIKHTTHLPTEGARLLRVMHMLISSLSAQPVNWEPWTLITWLDSCVSHELLTALESRHQVAPSACCSQWLCLLVYSNMSFLRHKWECLTVPYSCIAAMNSDYIGIYYVWMDVMFSHNSVSK